MPNIADILTAYGKVADFVRGRKTYIVSGLLVVVGLVRLIAGEIDITSFLASQDLVIVLNGLGLGFLRAGVNTQVSAPEPVVNVEAPKEQTQN